MNLEKALILAQKFGEKSNNGKNQEKLFQLTSELTKTYPQIAEDFRNYIESEIITSAANLSKLPDAVGWSIYELRRAIAALIFIGKTNIYKNVQTFADYQKGIQKEINAYHIEGLSDWVEFIGIQWPRVQEQKARVVINVEEKKMQEPSNVVPEIKLTVEQFSERFVEDKKLGEGSFGEVKLYTEKGTGKKYVGKLFTDVKEWNKELKILKHIKSQCSPYLLCIEFSVVISGGLKDRHLLMYDYIPDSTDLGNYIEKGNRWNDQITKNLLIGLVKLHQLGIVHRDVKPANILLETKNDAIHYIDYGLSCGVGNKMCLKGRTGTAMYTAPEQLVLGEATQKSDVWSLGMTLVHGLLRNDAIIVPIGSLLFFDNKFPSQEKMNEIASTVDNRRYTELLKAMLKVDESERVTAQQALDIFNRLFN